MDADPWKRHLVIRKAREEDLPALLQLHEDIALEGEPSLDPGRAAKIFARIAACPGYTIHVAQFEDEVVAVFSLFIMENLAHNGAPSAIVEDLVVAARLRGRGLGRRLMGYAMQQARQEGCYKLTLSSNLIRRDAHRFYDRLGFQRHGYSFLIELRPT